MFQMNAIGEGGTFVVSRPTSFPSKKKIVADSVHSIVYCFLLMSSARQGKGGGRRGEGTHVVEGTGWVGGVGSDDVA